LDADLITISAFDRGGSAMSPALSTTFFVTLSGKQ
jgi:hypothetical protein